ncbi:unnamed protein product [Arctogadus glacialis]
MEEKSLAIIGEISCDGISRGIDLRRGDAGRSESRLSPSPAARTSPALRISQDRPAATSSPASSTSQGTPPPSRRSLTSCRCSEKLIALEKEKLVVLKDIEEKRKEANDIARQALQDSARGKPTCYSATVLFDAHFECQSVKPKLYSSPLFCPRASYLSVPMANCVFRAPARFRSDRFSATGFVSGAKSRHGDANGHTAHGKTRAVTFEARGADR